MTAVIFAGLPGMALTRAFDGRESPSRRHLDHVKRLARRALLDAGSGLRSSEADLR